MDFQLNSHIRTWTQFPWNLCVTKLAVSWTILGWKLYNFPSLCYNCIVLCCSYLKRTLWCFLFKEQQNWENTVFCVCRECLFMCVKTHVPLCLSGGQRWAFMCMQRILVHMCADAYASVFIWRSEIGLHVCTGDALFICVQMHVPLCLSGARSQPSCVCRGWLFICVQLHVPLCVSGARDQSWMLFLRSHPPFFFLILFLTLCISEEYDVVILNTVLSEAKDIRSPRVRSHYVVVQNLTCKKYVSLAAEASLQPPPCFLRQGFHWTQNSLTREQAPGICSSPPHLTPLPLPPALITAELQLQVSSSSLAFMWVRSKSGLPCAQQRTAHIPPALSP